MCTFKNLEKIYQKLVLKTCFLETWKKFRKPGRNFPKKIGNPIIKKKLIKAEASSIESTKKYLI